jgi:hypothetical protein
MACARSRTTGVQRLEVKCTSSETVRRRSAVMFAVCGTGSPIACKTMAGVVIPLPLLDLIAPRLPCDRGYEKASKIKLELPEAAVSVSVGSPRGNTGERFDGAPRRVALGGGVLTARRAD